MTIISEKLWGGRFKAKTHHLTESFNASIHFDQVLAIEDILGSLAHATMLAHQKIIQESESQEIQKGLLKIANKISQGKIKFSEVDEDIHMNIERQLYQEIGEVAGKLHTARSRNDQIALDMHLYLRKEIIILIDLLVQMQAILIEIANTHFETIVPGYTHMQRAQPIYLALHLFAYVSMFQRDIERLQDCWKRVNLCPLGAGALAGNSFGIDRRYVANLLGFDDIYHNTIDAVSDRDFIAEFLFISSVIMMHFSRLSEELILWSSEEFNFIRFDDAFCTGSSIMPQKKNPDVAELSRGKTGRVYGALMTILTVLKGLPLAYNKDLQEDKEALFDTIKTLKMTLSVYIPMLESTQFLKDNMKSATRAGFLNATLLAEYLTKKELPFRKAHMIVGEMVKYCIGKSCLLEELQLEEMKKFSALIDKDIYILLNPENIVRHQRNNLEQEFAIRKKQVHETQSWVSETNNRLKKINDRFALPVINS